MVNNLTKNKIEQVLKNAGYTPKHGSRQYTTIQAGFNVVQNYFNGVTTFEIQYRPYKSQERQQALEAANSALIAYKNVLSAVGIECSYATSTIPNIEGFPVLQIGANN